LRVEGEYNAIGKVNHKSLDEAIGIPAINEGGTCPPQAD
jgi:hypothetical protein